MIQIQPYQINLTKDQFVSFEKNLQNFYSNVLASEKFFNVFATRIDEINQSCSEYDNKTKISVISNYITNFLGGRNFTQETCDILAMCYLSDDNVFRLAFQGGNANFVQYIKCFVASKYSEEELERNLLKNEIYGICREMAEIRYYSSNPADEAIR